MIKTGGALLLVLAAALTPRDVVAAEQTPGIAQWWNRVNEEVDALIAAHKHVPPSPVKLRWKPQRIWAGALAGQLLDLQSVDLGDDARDELVALSSKTVLVLSRHRGLIDVRGQVALPVGHASQDSRDPIGMLSVTKSNTANGETEVLLRARTSEQGAGAVYAWRDGTLERVSEFSGYPLCEDGVIDSAPGRNYFLGASAAWSHDAGGALSAELYSARCSRDLVDPTGAAMSYVSHVSTAGQLTVRCEGGPRGCPMPATQYPGVGYAHLITDLNNDGYAEVVTTSSSSRGSKDRVQVYSQGVGAPRLLFEREFEHGIVALTAGDFDGDGASELLVAQRHPKAGRVTLWRLN